MNRYATSRWLAALLIAVAILLITPVLHTAAQGETYFEDFDDGEAQGWMLDANAWTVTEGALVGSGPGWATYMGGDWSDLTLTFRLREFFGILHANIRVLGPTRYIAELVYEEKAIAVHLIKQIGPQTLTDPLASGRFVLDGYAQELLKTEGLPVQVDIYGGVVDVWVADQQIVSFEDPDPLPRGTIAFETLEQSFAVIDDLGVEGMRAEQPPERTEQPVPRPDLVIRSLNVERFEEGGLIVVLGADVANRGEAESPATEVLVANEIDPTLQARGAVDPLPPGGETHVAVRLELPDAWRGTQVRFFAQIDPDNLVEESNEDNNFVVSLLTNLPEEGGPPPEQGGYPPEEGPQGGGSLLLLGGIAAVVGLIVAGAAAIVIRNTVRIGQRRRWEQQAQEGRPPESCTPPQHYVEVENEVEIQRMRVTQIDLVSSAAGSQQARRRHSLKGSLAGEIDAAIRAHRLREQPERFAARIETLAMNLAPALAEFVRREPDACDLIASVHLEGIEVTSTFTLYRCVTRGGQSRWRKLASWKVRKQQTRDDAIVYLTGLDPRDATLPQWLPGVIAGPLREYVERY